jgi:hypothetical protein
MLFFSQKMEKAALDPQSVYFWWFWRDTIEFFTANFCVQLPSPASHINTEEKTTI